ncbi:hypothetical protein D9M70_449760 [compost metagenome]
MIKVAGGKRDIDVAGFADRLAIVDRLDDGDQTRMALDHAGECIEMPRPGMTRKLRPGSLRLAGGGNRIVDVLGAAERNFRQELARGRLARVERLAGSRRDKSAVDEVAELALVARQPLAGFGVGFERGAVGHFVKIPCDSHRDHPIGCRLRAE